MSTEVATSTPHESAPEPARTSSYRQILRSSVVMGSSTLFVVGAAVLRSKIVAVLLGPAGFGLMGLYSSVLHFAQSIATMGVQASGVREIAAAVGSDDERRFARTATALRWAVMGLGVIGGLLLAALARPVAHLTFGDHDHGLAIALLGIALVLQVIAAGYSALLQGTRHIGEIARTNAMTGLLGTVGTVGLVWWLGEDGVVPALIVFAATTFGFSLYYARRVKVPPLLPSWRETTSELRALFGLGFAFMASGMLAMGAPYFIRTLITRQMGLEAAGHYHAAWAIGSMYVGFVLDSMGWDFYPRLSAAIGDREEANRLVNEQARVSVLLAGPGVLATITGAQVVVAILYSSAFFDAVEVLRWLCLGASLRVIIWPMSYVIVAMARRGIFIAVEVTYAVIYVVTTFALVGKFGLAGAGAAFALSYALHGFVVYPIVRRMTGFRWSSENRRSVAVYLVVCLGVFLAHHVLPFWAAAAVGVLATALSGLHSARALASLVPAERMPRHLGRIVDFFRP